VPTSAKSLFSQIQELIKADNSDLEQFLYYDIEIY